MGWIKYKYSCRFRSNGSCVCDIPNIEVELSLNGKSMKFLGLIDSGCQVTMANPELAKAFNIDLTKCNTTKIGGVGGPGSTGFISNINMKLKDFDGVFSSPIIFTENLPVTLLLGQDNFFENFKVKFEKHNNTFELSKV